MRIRFKLASAEITSFRVADHPGVRRRDQKDVWL